MSDSNVIKLAQPGAFTDSLTEILRSGARALPERKAALDRFRRPSVTRRKPSLIGRPEAGA